MASAIENPTLAEDRDHLARQLGCEVDLLREGDQVGVLVPEFPLPPGIYSKHATDILLRTTIQYPLSEMDMFWVDEDLLLADGRVPTGGESLEVHFGRPWRRFSWHRNSPWEPGRDSLVGHFEFALARLGRSE